MHFLFVDQAQRLDTGFAEKLVEDHFGYFKEDTFERDIEKGQNDSNYNCKNYHGQAK